MGYFYLVLQAVIFSFGGLLIKAAGTICSPFMLSAFRFLIGTILLLFIQKMRDGKIHLKLVNSVLILGGIFKALHYAGENFGVMRGFSYGGIVVWPVQTVVVLLVSVLLYHEHFSRRVLTGAALCVSGVGIVSWNGASWQSFYNNQAVTLIAFILAGCGAAGFILMQKKVIGKLNAVELNSSMFTYGFLSILLVLIPSGPHFKGSMNLPGILSILLLGIITCVGFLLQAEAIKTVPLLIATIIQSSTVILNIFWGVLIYKDDLSGYVIFGSALFLTGIVLINLRKKPVSVQ